MEDDLRLGDDLRRRIEALERRLANAVRIGTVFDLDAGAARVRVRDGALETGWIRWTAGAAGDDRAWRAPSIGEQVVFVCPAGDPEQAVALGRLYRTQYPAPSSAPGTVACVFGDGLVVTHDKTRKWTRISARDSGGVIEIEAKTIALRTGARGGLLTDIFGKASLTRHAGGPTYETESWSDGAVVTALPTKPLHQPELPTEEVIDG